MNSVVKPKMFQRSNNLHKFTNVTASKPDLTVTDEDHGEVFLLEVLFTQNKHI